MTEESLAREVVEWLTAQHWTVYQEVGALGNCCDIVATRGAVLWAIECKTRLSLSVIGQARFWTKFAHFSSVAVPQPKHAVAQFATVVLRDYGIGCLLVQNIAATHSARVKALHQFSPTIREGIYPKLHRRISSHLRDSLREEHKHWAPAGNARGARFTPFQKTAQVVLAVVDKLGSIALKDLITAIDHHYSSNATARRCLKDLIESGVIDGVTIRRDGRAILVERANGKAIAASS